MFKKEIIGAAVIVMSSVAVPSPAADGSLTEALKDGTVNAEIRLRYETVDQDGFAEEADALTLRARLGYTTGLWNNLVASAEFAANTTLGIDDYNSTANGQTQFPVIADPEDTVLVQGYLAWRPVEHTTVKGGRQRIGFDNERFVGSVGWRQLEQTFDGLSVVTQPVKRFTGTFAHLTNTNRIQGEHNPLVNADLNADLELLNAEWTTSAGKLTGYGYLIDMEDAPLLSNQTLGVRFTGKTELKSRLDLLYTAEIAQQSDYRDGMASIDAEYIHAVVGVGLKKVTIKVGYELLGSNAGTFGFSTPLATLHAHNGWADKFLSTPVSGLKDTYVSVAAKLAGLKLVGVFHQFAADFGGMDYGSEIDLLVARKFGKHYSAMLKFADYSSDGFATDTTKIWLMASAGF